MTQSMPPKASDPSPSSTAKPIKKTSKVRRIAWLKWLGLIAIIIALASISSLLGYRFWTLQRQLLTTERHLESVISITQSQVQAQKLALNNLQTLTAQQQTALNQDQAQLQRLLQHAGQSSENWVLAEVRYLLHLAQLNVNFFHDLSTTKVLLETADQNIQALNDASLNQLRQAIADDIAKLENARHLDLEGLLTRLHAIAGQINQLPLLAPQPTRTSLAVPQSAPSGHWRQALAASMEHLQKLIIIRRTEQTLAPLLAPEQRFYLEQNIILLLSKAEYALLHNQPSLYRSYLQQVSQWIQRYYAAHATATQTVLASLAQLQQTDISAASVDLSHSITVLNQIINQRRKPLQMETTNLPAPNPTTETP